MTSISGTERVEQLLGQLAVAEKADLVTGAAMWATGAVERLGIPGLTVTDGPNGARGAGLMGTGTPTACIPAGSVLGATWDPELLERLGGLLGEEALAKGANVLLAPTINLHRTALGGRNFECYSEDPVLTGSLAAGFVRGAQSRQVATTPKHFVANDSEFERNLIDVQVDERTLREVYLLPFEMAVKEGRAWGIMSAYNRLNGTFCSENEWLLSTVLRDEWGFDGFVVTDWFAARSTAASVRAGLSLEMPGEGRFYGRENLESALAAGEISSAELDAIAADLLLAAERTGALDGVGGGEESELDRPADRALAREAAAAGTVLISNDGTLPLNPEALASIALIGPNAAAARVMGGGSAKVRSYRATSPVEALQRRLGEKVAIRHAQGCNIDRSTPPIAPPLLETPLHVEFYGGHEPAGDVLATTVLDVAEFTFFGAPAPGVPDDAFSLRAIGSVRAEVNGEHALRLVQCGRTRIYLDGEPVLDATDGDFETGEAFFGFGSAEIEARVQLDAGQSIEVIIEFSNKEAVILAGAIVGLVPLAERDLVSEAVTLAAACDAAIVVVGTNDDWETEGRDREQFDLPGLQPELIRRVAEVNSRTVVVVNTGGPHAMDWMAGTAAVLNVGFGGQEFGDALVDVLLGEVDPGGRMPTTIPRRYEHAPALLNYPGENSVVRYGEGLHIGYRWFDRRAIEPLVPFGHGLSYAAFEWQPPHLPQRVPTGKAVTVEVDVVNTGDRAGSDVVQVYVEPPESRLGRPVRELKGFAKIYLERGQTGTARVDLEPRAFAYFDPADPVFEALDAAMPVPTGSGSERRTEPGWYIEPGLYRIVVARSAADFAHVADLELTGSEVLYAP